MIVPEMGTGSRKAVVLLSGGLFAVVITAWRAEPRVAAVKRERDAAASYQQMSTEELAATTAEFDREMVASRSRSLTAAERRAWEAARRKPGRPRKGAGVKVISVSVERGLLLRSDALARSLGLSRAALIERGLKALLAEVS